MRKSIRLTASLAAATLASALLPSANAVVGHDTAWADVTPAEATPSQISWKECEHDPRFDCSSLRVPLDYDNPEGPQIRLNLLRDPADNAERRLGSLLVNPGGPGASATSFAAEAAQHFGHKVTNRYDLVGVDPRGVTPSPRVVCRGNDSHYPAHPYVSFPYGALEQRRWLRADADERRFCAANHSRIFHHVTTADTARDLDEVRSALGEDQINYYGFSYGTYLGQTYAALFPQHVGAFVLDGVLDPVAWSTGRGSSADRLGFSTRIRSGQGAYEALTSALVECDRVGARRCAAADNALRKWQVITQEARRGNLVMGDSRIPYSTVISYVLGAMYEPTEYGVIGQYIQHLYRATREHTGRATGHRNNRGLVRTTGRLHESWLDRLRNGLYGASVREYSTAASRRVVEDPFSAISCADTANPADPHTWVRASKRDDRVMPWFGRLWTWRSSICSSWPGSSADAYHGPWSTHPATPMLMIGNTHDPATPVSGARAATRKFHGSRLLLLDGWGHGALGRSDCVVQRIQTYLVSGRLPASGTVCRPDVRLYPRSSS